MQDCERGWAVALRLAIGFGLVAAVLVGLAVTRLWHVAAAGLRRSRARERELRRAGEALRSATGVEAVSAVVGEAVSYRPPKWDAIRR